MSETRGHFIASFRGRYAACRTHLRPPSLEVNTYLAGALPVLDTATRIVPNAEVSFAPVVRETLTMELNASMEYQ